MITASTATTHTPLRTRDVERPSWNGLGLKRNRRGGEGVANCPSFQLCLWTSCMRWVACCPVSVPAYVFGHPDLLAAPPSGLVESVLDNQGIPWCYK